MKKFAAAGLTAAAIMTTGAMIFAPVSFGAASELPQNDIEWSDTADTGSNLESAGRASGAWHQPPSDASMNKFVVALAATR